MALKKFTIELKVDYDDDSKTETIRNIGRGIAKHWHTSALLLQDNRGPQLAYHSDDMFEGTQEISLAEDPLADDTLEVTTNE